MSLTALTICPKCRYNSNTEYAMSGCLRCVEGSKFEPTRDAAHEFILNLDEWETYCRNNLNPLEKAIEEVREKEKMFANNLTQVNDIKVIFNGRECNVLNMEIKHPGDPRELPTIKLECSVTKSSIPYHEYAKQKKTTEEPKFPTIRAMDIKNVIFNPPATIVFWADGTKTVVKAENEDFDPEKGLAMAITKKILGNTGHYFEIVKKLTKDAPVGEPVSDLEKVYNQGAEDKWAEIKAKLREFEAQLVVGNRITRKFFNEFNEFVESISKEDEA